MAKRKTRALRKSSGKSAPAGPAPSRSTPSSAKPSRPASLPLIRFLPLALLLLLLVIVGAVTAVFFLSPEPGVFHYPEAAQSGACQAGTSIPCTAGSCSGTVQCLADGTWGDCTWERACTPGSRIPCLKDGCAYAYRECDPCGAGYGGCITPSKAG